MTLVSALQSVLDRVCVFISSFHCLNPLETVLFWHPELVCITTSICLPVKTNTLYRQLLFFRLSILHLSAMIFLVFFEYLQYWVKVTTLALVVVQANRAMVGLSRSVYLFLLRKECWLLHLNCCRYLFLLLKWMTCIIRLHIVGLLCLFFLSLPWLIWHRWGRQKLWS